jgi:hypothetical protein
MACGGPDHPDDRGGDARHRARISHRPLPDCLALTLRSQTLWGQIARKAFE